MKPSVIHDNHAFSFKTWDQCVFAPVVKYIAVNIFLKVIKRKQHLFIQSTNDVGSLFTLPIIAINTRLTYQCITMRANGLVLKAAFIHIYNGVALLRQAIEFTVIRCSFYWARFWVF